MNCIKCRSEIKRHKTEVYRHGEHSYLRLSCAKCGAIQSEEKTGLSTINRLLPIIIGLPFAFIYLTLLSIFIKGQNFVTDYIAFSSLTLLFVIFLFFISIIRLRNKQK